VPLTSDNRHSSDIFCQVINLNRGLLREEEICSSARDARLQSALFCGSHHVTEQHFYMGLTAIPQECKNCPMVGWASRLWGEVIELKIRGQDQVQMSSF